MSRRVIARNEQKCRDCREMIKKGEECIQKGKHFFHTECYAKFWWLWQDDKPKMTETVRQKQLRDWCLKKIGQEQSSR